jgi:hypothetical protein
MYRAIVIGIVLLCASEANAQVIWSAPWGYHHASTAAEGYLTGKARLHAANGLAARYFGQYLVDRERAYNQHIQNEADRIRTRWEIQDEYRARQRSLHPNYLERKARSLDMAEQRHALKLREEELRKKGILPPKPEPYFAYKGVKFKSYDEFKKSDLYWEMIKERDKKRAEREAEEAAAEARRQESIDFMRMWAKMSFLARERYSRLSPEEKARTLREFKNPDLMWKRLEDDQNRKFYESRPWLIPNAGKNGYPPYPGPRK